MEAHFANPVCCVTAERQVMVADHSDNNSMHVQRQCIARKMDIIGYIGNTVGIESSLVESIRRTGFSSLY